MKRGVFSVTTLSFFRHIEDLWNWKSYLYTTLSIYIWLLIYLLSLFLVSLPPFLPFLLSLSLSPFTLTPPLPFFITLYLSHVPCPHASHRPHTPIPEAETFHPVHDSLQVPFTSVSVSSCPIPCSSALSSLLGSPCAPIPQQNGREEREEEGRQRREGGGQR